MLLRSASTPILNSWVPISKDCSEDRTRSVTHLSPSIILSSSSSNSPFPIDESVVSSKKIKRASSENDIRELAMPPAVPKRKAFTSISSISIEEGREERGSNSSLVSLDRLFSTTGLDEGCCVVGTGLKDKAPQTLFSGGGFRGVGGGGICGGRGGGADGDDGDIGFGFSDSNYGNNITDVYYRNMIEANPGNALLLGNYARFLKEVRGDLVKAEEYCSRAILANPGNADVLSLYADLIWQTHKDAERAENYFDQAIQAAPDDCYVMASYAHFLWDAEEDVEEEEGKKTPSLLQLVTAS